MVLALAVPFAATASPSSTKLVGGGALLSKGLLDEAKANPGATFRVIVQGESSGAVAKLVGSTLGKVSSTFSSIHGVAASLTGTQLQALADAKGLTITRDVPTKALNRTFWNKQNWPYVSGDAKAWPGAANGHLTPPAIAIVDTGIDAARADFGGRVIKSVNMVDTSGTGNVNSSGDGRGHGTFVASLAAGQVSGYTGSVPNAPLVSIDVMDDTGMGYVSDVIEAADWILANKNQFNIRVANFSLHAASDSSFMHDPLDKAVEKLWFSGVVVVAASGNYAQDGQQSGVRYAPGNDPFVITVGALDTKASMNPNDDTAAPWSAYGYTHDGFFKPEISAPGRYMNGAVSAGTTLAAERPGNVVAPGYMQMSGTSFAAPVVAGAAAFILANNPTWTPDQVKGALMLTARSTAAGSAGGVGEVWAVQAANLQSPPNPNAALNQFVVADSNPSGKAFDAAAWSSKAQSDAAWSSAAWSSAAWSSAAWSSAAWSSAAWSSAAWSSAAWSDAAWSDAAWSSAAWSTSAEGEVSPEGEAANGVTADDYSLIESEFGITPPAE